MYSRTVGWRTIEATRGSMRGESAFSLIDRPRHHATRDRAMGFCYSAISPLLRSIHWKAALNALPIWDSMDTTATERRRSSAQSPNSICVDPSIPLSRNGREIIREHRQLILSLLFTPRSRHVDVAERSLEKLRTFNPICFLFQRGSTHMCGTRCYTDARARRFREIRRVVSNIDIPSGHP